VLIEFKTYGLKELKKYKILVNILFLQLVILTIGFMVSSLIYYLQVLICTLPTISSQQLTTVCYHPSK